MKYTKVRQNFVYPEIKHTDRQFGASIVLPVLRENGDWRDYLPPTEEQNINGIESSACYIEAQQHTVATLLEEMFDIKDSNFSARFNALLSNGGEDGGDPVAGAKSIKFDGLIKQDSMPFKNIGSWEEFHSWKGVNKISCLAEGKKWIDKWDARFKVIVEDNFSLKTKYDVLRTALKTSPCPISVTAWYEENGLYIKPEGLKDNHLVEAVFLDDKNRIYVRDTYAPFDKILEPNYDFEFACVWTLKPKKERPNWVKEIVFNIFWFFKDILKLKV